MLRFKKLKTEKELQEFCDNYHGAVKQKPIQGFELTLESIKLKDRVVGVYQNNKMIAGYALSNTPYSLLSNITEENRKKMEQIAPLESCFDLGNIWKKNGFSKVLFNAIVWPRIVIDTITFNRKKSNVIGYVFTGHGRTDSYNMAKPVMLQSSPIKNELNIFVVSKKNLTLAFLKGLVEESIQKPYEKITHKLFTAHKATQEK